MEPTTHRPAERASWMLLLGVLFIPILVTLIVIVQLWPWTAFVFAAVTSVALFVTRRRP